MGKAGHVNSPCGKVRLSGTIFGVRSTDIQRLLSTVIAVCEKNGRQHHHNGVHTSRAHAA